MFNFTSLYSGSSGNCLLLETTNSKFLIDIGVSTRKIEQSLDELNILPSKINGILITHEHMDHIYGIKTFVKKYNPDVYVDKKVKPELEKYIDTSKSNVKTFNAGEKFAVDDLEISSFKTSHDAINPCGFSFFHDNIVFSVATDLGYITKEVLNSIEESNFIHLESNYDKNVLMTSPYPYFLKERIKSNIGHLENIDAGKTIAHLAKCNLKGCTLGHLSAKSNIPELAKTTVFEQLEVENIDKEKIEIQVAPRDKRTKVFNLLDYGEN